MFHPGQERVQRPILSGQYNSGFACGSFKEGCAVAYFGFGSYGIWIELFAWMNGMMPKLRDKAEGANGHFGRYT